MNQSALRCRTTAWKLLPRPHGQVHVGPGHGRDFPAGREAHSWSGLHCFSIVSNGIGAHPRGMRNTRDIATIDQSTDSGSPISTGTAADGSLDRPGRTVWTLVSGGLGGIVGLAPHVLHHIGPLVGTALVAGAGGTVIFGVLGLVASVPMLVKLRLRFSNWWAPAIALAVFAAMFLISSLVIGPRISAPDNPAGPGVIKIDHIAHHS